MVVTERGTATTLAGPRRCAYCGHRCHGRTCRYCQDLERAERAVWELPKGDGLPTIRDELHAVVRGRDVAN